jgi:hypothetical protein
MTSQTAGGYVTKSVNFSVDHSTSTLQEEAVSSVQMTHLLLTKQHCCLTEISSIVSMELAVMVGTVEGWVKYCHPNPEPLTTMQVL